MNINPTHPGAEFIAKMFGPSTLNPVYVCTLPNADVRDREPVTERFVTTRSAEDIAGFANKWDRPNRALYYAVNTVRQNARRRAKDTISEIHALYADIDFKDVEENPQEIRQALDRLMLSPTVVNFTGHGLHVLWLFKEAIAATPETIAEIEALLRLLADHVAGDLQAAEVSRLLRLPGTHNSKNGDCIEVVTERFDPTRRYEMDDLHDWLEIAHPVLRRKPRTNGADTVLGDPWEELAKRQRYKPHVDVEARLHEMRFQGPGESGIHFTQLAVTASLLSHGEPIDDVVNLMLEATRAAAGPLGANWNWRREEREIRKMCGTWIAKHPPPPSTETDIKQELPPPPQSEADVEPGLPPPPTDEADIQPKTPRRKGAKAKTKPTPPIPSPQPSGHKRPIIKIVAGKLAEVVEMSERALMDAGFKIFALGPLLTYPSTVEALASDGRTTRTVRLREVAPDQLRLWLAKAAAFVKYDARSKKWVNANPPRDLATTILASPDQWLFPPIAAVITSPILRPDNSVLCEAGYDPATRLYLDLDPDLRMPPIGGTETEAQEALALLEDLLEEFVFAKKTDKSVALALMLTHVARSAMPVAPLFLIRATTPGTGKSYLVDLVAAIMTGEASCPVIAAGGDTVETEKRLGAILCEGATIVALDNCSKDLEGDALAQYVERPRVRVRRLGVSEAPRLENRAIVSVTGNNIGPKGDMVRRTLTCNLVANCERPELREFAHDPVAMVLANRGAYLAACLTIIRAYQAARCPGVDAKSIGSFKRWSALVRAPLLWLGEADPLESMETARDEDPELIDIRDFFDFWKQHLAAFAPCNAYKIYEEATERDLQLNALKRPEFRDFLLRVAGNERGLVSPKKLGAWLRRIAGRIVDGKKLAIAIAADAAAKRGPKFLLEEVQPK